MNMSRLTYDTSFSLYTYFVCFMCNCARSIYRVITIAIKTVTLILYKLWNKCPNFFKSLFKIYLQRLIMQIKIKFTFFSLQYFYFKIYLFDPEFTITLYITYVTYAYVNDTRKWFTHAISIRRVLSFGIHKYLVILLIAVWQKKILDMV